MPVAIRAATRIQDMDDANVSLGVGVDEYALCWDNDTARFVLRAPTDLSGYALLAGRAGGQTLYGGTAANEDITIHGTSNATRTTSYVLLQPTAGNVGIGTTAPTYKLDIDARGSSSGFRVLGYSQDGIADKNRLTVSGGSGYGSVDISPTIFSCLNFDRIDLDARAETYLINVRGQLTSYSNTNFRIQPQSGYNILLAPSGGSVGIGTTSPATALHVVGAATITGGIRPAADSTTALQLQNVAGTSILNVDTTNSRVGIGTSAPGAMLGIVGNPADTTTPVLRVTNDDSRSYMNSFELLAPNIAAGQQLYSAMGKSASTNNRAAITYNHVADGSASNYMAFGIFYGGTGTGISIIPTGFVGINDTAPTEALDVTGNINTTGVVKVDDVQVLSNRVIDARCADAANSGDATTDGLIDALRDAMIAHGLIAAA